MEGSVKVKPLYAWVVAVQGQPQRLKFQLKALFMCRGEK
jgi:hypothetical protein